jgi:Raf kinase inhibitor-like YbhB/YbcL family protein
MKLNTLLGLITAVTLGFSASIYANGRAPFTLTSNLRAGEPIPQDYYGNDFGCAEKSESPSLEWKNAPEKTKSFAITFYDQDAPTGSGFWHYVLFDIPATVTRIEVGDLRNGKIPDGAIESLTDRGRPGFFGPCPPSGRKHTYRYTVHALNVEKLGLDAKAMPAIAGFNFWGHSLGQASFTITAGPRK